tara:strand:+ start:192 stop:1157 length:966 start_codon:yes stop_codon:yes gene_type:complete
MAAKNMNEVILLEPSLLDDSENLKDIIFWQHAMNRPQGWHYDLDFLWILKSLKDKNIGKNATILDAGGGLGPFQYILSARGYNVVSLDFSRREPPIEAKGLFNITVDEKDFNYDHDYQDFISLQDNVLLKDKVIKALKEFNWLSLRWIFYKLKTWVLHTYFSKKAKFTLDKRKFGNLTFRRAAFHDIPYEDNYFDAVVSISAIEHADKNLLKQNISEILRVVDPSGMVLLTTSSSTNDQEEFDYQTSGWCFSSDSISKIMGREVSFRQQDLESASKKILTSEHWRRRLDPYYLLDKGSPFSKKKIKSLPYLPIGFVLTKTH